MDQNVFVIPMAARAIDLVRRIWGRKPNPLHDPYLCSCWKSTPVVKQAIQLNKILSFLHLYMLLLEEPSQVLQNISQIPCYVWNPVFTGSQDKNLILSISRPTSRYMRLTIYRFLAYLLSSVQLRKSKLKFQQSSPLSTRSSSKDNQKLRCKSWQMKYSPYKQQLKLEVLPYSRTVMSVAAVITWSVCMKVNRPNVQHPALAILPRRVEERTAMMSTWLLEVGIHLVWASYLLNGLLKPC